MPHNKLKAKTPSKLGYRLMSLSFKVRDILKPRKRVLEEVGIKSCFHVLDYGCGTGSYILPTIKLIGRVGTYYALDMNPLAIKMVQQLIVRKKLSNVHPILSDCDTGLPPVSIDVVLLYDILHHLENRPDVFVELHRILRPEGIMSVTDHHLEKNDIITRVIKSGLFKLKLKGKMTLSFSKDKR